MTELMRRRRVLMGIIKEEDNSVKFATECVNGEIGVTTITIPENSVANASQIFPLFNSMIGNNQKLLAFSAIKFTEENNGIKYGFPQDPAKSLTSKSSLILARYRNGSVVEINTDSSVYDAHLSAGDQYLVLHATLFTTSTS